MKINKKFLASITLVSIMFFGAFHSGSFATASVGHTTVRVTPRVTATPHIAVTPHVTVTARPVPIKPTTTGRITVRPTTVPRNTVINKTVPNNTVINKTRINNTVPIKTKTLNTVPLNTGKTNKSLSGYYLNSAANRASVNSGGIGSTGRLLAGYYLINAVNSGSVRNNEPKQVDKCMGSVATVQDIKKEEKKEAPEYYRQDVFQGMVRNIRIDHELYSEDNKKSKNVTVRVFNMMNGSVDEFRLSSKSKYIRYSDGDIGIRVNGREHRYFGFPIYINEKN